MGISRRGSGHFACMGKRKGEGKGRSFCTKSAGVLGLVVCFHESMPCRGYLTFADARFFSLNTDAFGKQRYPRYYQRHCHRLLGLPELSTASRPCADSLIGVQHGRRPQRQQQSPRFPVPPPNCFGCSPNSSDWLAEPDSEPYSGSLYSVASLRLTGSSSSSL